MSPPLTTATSFVPSDDEATDDQFWMVARWVPVAAKSVDV